MLSEEWMRGLREGQGTVWCPKHNAHMSIPFQLGAQAEWTNLHNENIGKWSVAFQTSCKISKDLEGKWFPVNACKFLAFTHPGLEISRYVSELTWSLHRCWCWNTKHSRIKQRCSLIVTKSSSCGDVAASAEVPRASYSDATKISTIRCLMTQLIVFDPSWSTAPSIWNNRSKTQDSKSKSAPPRPTHCTGPHWKDVRTTLIRRKTTLNQ